ncbi:MAG: hypothetical protein QGH73_14930 [Rhodospirillales bacterium]|jgi:hypothetical protein|nr:hypothetical protein [Rhodospirillaceae bacterium]MDP6428428.1 hypothetical protein [Rhodospirillales bacterium]MDP6644229.1 hypothetical protein [Rhodospirillales bacterium]MDP6842964.1 hypothetical protein [Rhodospirillales bacterium]|tara:strand:+ start:227 stop:580 length:354 start_codon:yes stop_codon:yes gene_type:complete
MSGHKRNLKDLAEAALSILAAGGLDSGDGARTARAARDGIEFNISLSGPDPAPEFPDGICPPEIVRETPGWTGTHTLKVMTPLNVLEISWNEGEAPRIMAFSRGTWEDALGALAGRG